MLTVDQFVEKSFLSILDTGETELFAFDPFATSSHTKHNINLNSSRDSYEDYQFCAKVVVIDEL